MINEDITLKAIRKPPWDIRFIAVLCFLGGAFCVVVGLLWLLPIAKTLDHPGSRYVLNLFQINSRESIAIYYIISGILQIIVGRGIDKIRRWGWWMFVLLVLLHIDVRAFLAIVNKDPYMFRIAIGINAAFLLWAIYRIKFFWPLRGLDQRSSGDTTLN